MGKFSGRNGGLHWQKPMFFYRENLNQYEEQGKTWSTYWILLAYLQNIGSSRPDSGVSHRLKGVKVSWRVYVFYSLEEEYEFPKLYMCLWCMVRNSDCWIPPLYTFVSNMILACSTVWKPYDSWRNLWVSCTCSEQNLDGLYPPH